MTIRGASFPRSDRTNCEPESRRISAHCVVDLVNLRLVGPGDGAAVALEEQLGALMDLRLEGKLDVIGLSNVAQATVERALHFVDVAEIQNGYSILERHDDEQVEFAQQREIAFVSFAPLGSAHRGGPDDWLRKRPSLRWPAGMEQLRRKSPWHGCWPATTGCS